MFANYLKTNIHSLNERISDKPGCVGEEGNDDDVHVTNPGGDGIRPVEERDTAQRAHGHGYSWIDILENNV